MSQNQLEIPLPQPPLNRDHQLVSSMPPQPRTYLWPARPQVRCDILKLQSGTPISQTPACRNCVCKENQTADLLVSLERHLGTILVVPARSKFPIVASVFTLLFCPSFCSAKLQHYISMDEYLLSVRHVILIYQTTVFLAAGCWPLLPKLIEVKFNTPARVCSSCRVPF